MSIVIVVIAALSALLVASIRVLREYERGVMFTLGRYSGTKGPGLIQIGRASCRERV